MAVYTDISEAELRKFLSAYDVGDLLSYKGIAEGVENSNFLLHTSKSAYILTLYEKRVERDDLPFFLGLMEHLARQGMSCPLPVHDSQGQALGVLAGRPAALITFLEGMWPRRPTANHCSEVGKVIAQMHIAGQDFSLTRKNALSVGNWRPLWDLSSARANEVEADLTSEIEADLDLLEAGWPASLPSGVIHADAFPDNVFFLGERFSGLIDFYFACNDFLAYDVAICLNAWCFEKDGSFNATKGMALLAGYQSVRPLSAEEADALPMLAHGSALRFFLTRLHDWLVESDGAMVVKKDPMEYLRYVRFHRNVASATEYGLRRMDDIT